LRCTFEVAPARADVERALAAHAPLELALDGHDLNVFAPAGDPRELTRALLGARELGALRTFSFGASSLAELYRELYGVEGV
ncbi:MAG: hypothetical protein ABL998_19630, partial [Planctomycetota bacterium]